MRLDKFFSSQKILTRSECSAKLKKGAVSVNGEVVKKGDFKIDPEKDAVALDGATIGYQKYVYILLNKPVGIVSATEDARDKTVLDLLPEETRKRDLFPCGRLDKDTTGLVVLTDDGASAHEALAPKNKNPKKYRFKVADEYSDEDVKSIEKGITLRDGYTTAPCSIERIDEKTGYITLVEGKYHEIKRLFGARGNKITELERISFGKIQLGFLPLGEWRYMTDEEIDWFVSKNKTSR